MALGQKEVRLSIKANTAKFEEELKKLPGVTDKEAKKMARKMSRQFDKAERDAAKSAKKMSAAYKGSFGKMGKAAQNFQKVLAAGVFATAAAGVFKLANSASEYVDKVMLMSEQTGLASETLIGMEFAAEAAGANLEQLQSGLNAFVMKAGQAANIGGASAAVFDRLGVSVKDTAGELRSTDDIFRDTIESISNLDSASEKATTAAELFGSRGAKLAAVFADGTGSLDEWTAKAKEAGVVMDKEALKASADMDRAMADLKLTMRGAAQEIGVSLIPAMVEIAKAMGVVIGWIGKAASAWDTLTDRLFANTDQMQTWQDDLAEGERSVQQLRRTLLATGQEVRNTGGALLSSSDAALMLQRRLDQAEDAFVSFNQGYAPSREESKKLSKLWAEARQIAKELGINWVDLNAAQRDGVEAMREVNDSDFDDLESALEDLADSAGSNLNDVGESAEDAAERLAALNEKWRLDLLSESDPVRGEFVRRMTEINEAALAGLDPALVAKAEEMANEARAKGLQERADREKEEREERANREKEERERRLEADRKANEAELEQRREMEEKIAEIQQKRIDAKREAEALAAQAAAELQEQFLGGTIDLANDVFELAKAQRGITFEQAKKLAIAQAIMNTIVGVTQELKKGLPGIATGAIVAAQGAVKVAMIQGQTMHAGGMVGGQPDERPANLLTGEAVITRAGVDALGGAQAVNAINSGAGMQPMIIVNKYKHRTLDVQIRDQLRMDGSLSRAVAGGGRMGHR